jgi:hypothetical protein
LDRLPGSRWLTYLAIGLVLLLVPNIAVWTEGAAPFGTFIPAFAYLAAATTFILWLIRYLDGRASAALVTLRPALKASHEEYAKLAYRLANLPARSVLLAGFVTLAVVFLTEAAGEGPYRLEALDGFPASHFALRVTYLTCWWVFGTFVYHTIHQLRLINHIYSERTSINLFQMTPLYAFSNLTALTAGSLTVIPLGWLAANPEIGLDDPVVLVMVLAIQFLAAVTFLWPQLGIHRLQGGEKNRLLDEANQRLEAIINELHCRVDDGELERVGELNTTITTLQAGLKVTKGIPTWPWQPETVRWLATALVLPLGLWLLQYVLQSLLGR